jgi:putative flippase GtrA
VTAVGTRCLKFYAVGGLGIIVQLAALEILTAALHLNYLLATALAVEAAIVHNYVWHERFTWADRSDPRTMSRFLKFNLTTGAMSILANVAIMRLLLSFWKVNYLLANVITITACSVVNFLVSDRVVFKDDRISLSSPRIARIPCKLFCSREI